MNKQVYDKQKMTAYLLGSLPDAEVETFDELSFTDDDFADQLNSAEKDLVDAYVRGALSGGELENFESYYLASPLRREKVRFAGAFQDFAARQAAEAGAQSPVVEETSRREGFFARLFAAWSVFAGRRGLLPFGLAAAILLLMASGVWLVMENNRLSEQARETERKRDELLEREKQLQEQLKTEQAAKSDTAKELAEASEERERLEAELKSEKSRQQQIAPPQKRRAQESAPPQSAPLSPPKISIASFVLAPPLRGGSQIPNLSIPRRTDFVRLQLELEPNDFASYRVALTDQAGKKFWLSGSLKAKRSGENQTLAVRLPAKLLKSQIYTLVVSGVAPDRAPEVLSNYSFRAVLE